MKQFDDLLAQLEDCHCDVEECECSEVLAHLFEIVDENMPQSQAERLLRHSAKCPHCNEMIRSEVRVRVALRRCCGGDVAPAQLRERILLGFASAESK